MPESRRVFLFHAQVVGVHDGDTATLLIDCGFRQFRADKFRLKGINAPELHDPDPAVQKRAVAARDRLAELLGWPPPGGGGPSLDGPWPLWVEVEKDPEKYGRWLCTVRLKEGGPTVNATLLAEGHAVPFMVDR